MPTATAAKHEPANPPNLSAISLRGLTKVWSDGRRAVDELSVEVPRGKVVGFIGPNGSGKTTTFRMLLGLVHPTSGTAEVLGESISRPRAYLPRVGSVVETPALYPNLTGTQNLKVLCRLGGWNQSRIRELIDAAEIDADTTTKVGTYSLGNRQRLAIAAALLADPELLLLDEPGNGLDPIGTRDLRRFLRNLAAEGKTVFLSSHQLGELEQVCDAVVMIQRGRLLFEGPLEALLESGSRLVAVAERSDDHDAVVRIGLEAGHRAVEHSGRVWIDAPPGFEAELNRRCMEADVTLVELVRHRKDLESLFVEIADNHGKVQRG